MGIGIRFPIELGKGCTVYVQGDDGHPAGYAVVRHCRAREGEYVVGLELAPETRDAGSPGSEPDGNYYDFLQISPRAEPETIQRIFHYLAARFHPDNPDTGDPEKFVRLTRAYEVLSRPERRADYDASLDDKIGSPNPAFECIDYMDGPQGEINRRLAVLAVLYRKGRANIEESKVSLMELEALMGFPREYLNFTTWYLRKKNYITREDNSDFALTVLGVDYVEANYSKLPVLRKMLNAGVVSGAEERSNDQEPRTVGGILLQGEVAREDGDISAAGEDAARFGDDD